MNDFICWMRSFESREFPVSKSNDDDVSNGDEVIAFVSGWEFVSNVSVYESMNGIKGKNGAITVNFVYSSEDFKCGIRKY